MANNQIIISRIQNRRGLKENLPQPLLPGEIALTVDTGELWIGSDPNQPPYGVRTYSSGSGDITTAETIVDTQITSAKFTADLSQVDFDSLVEFLIDPTALATEGAPAVVLFEDDILWDGLQTVFIATDIAVDAANTINNVLDAIALEPANAGTLFDSARSGALGAAYTANGPYIETDATSLTFATGPNTITRAGGTSDFVTEGFADGQKIVITGSPSNDGTYTITGAPTGTVITVVETLVAEGPVTTATLRGRTDPASELAFDAIDGDYQFSNVLERGNATQGANAAILINELNGGGLVTTFGNLQITTSGIGVGSPTFRDMTVTDTDVGYTWAAEGTASADSTTDELTFVSGNNINIDVDTTNDAIRITNTAEADPDKIITGFTDTPTGNNVATEALLPTQTPAFANVPGVIFDIDGDSDIIFLEYSLNIGANVPGSNNYTAIGRMRLVANNLVDSGVATLVDDQTVVRDTGLVGDIEFQAVRVAGTPSTSATSLEFVNSNPDTILYDAGPSDFLTDGFTPGMEITVAGSELANNGVYVIQTVTANTITLTSDAELVAETVAASITGRNQVQLQYTSTFVDTALLRLAARRWMSYDYAPVPPPPPFLMVLGVFAPADEGNAYGSQYVSSTGIDTWTETPAVAPANTAFYRPDALAYKAATNTFVAGSSSSTSAIHAYTTNDGTSWTIATRVDFMTSFAIAYNPTADRWVSVGNSGKAQYSDDDGATWVSGATQPSGNLRDVIWSPTNNLWFACTLTNEVYKSSDGTNWSLTAAEPGGPSSNQLLSLWTVGNRLFAGTGDIGATGATIYYSDDDGDTWTAPTSIATISSASSCDNIGYDGSGVLMACSQLNNGDSLWRSTDNGVNWTAEATGIAGTQNYADIKYDSQASVWILVGGVQNTASKIWTSPTGLNGTWTEQENGTGTDGFGQVLEVIGGKTIVLPT